LRTDARKKRKTEKEREVEVGMKPLGRLPQEWYSALLEAWQAQERPHHAAYGLRRHAIPSSNTHAI
jgi:hypothetical protein